MQQVRILFGILVGILFEILLSQEDISLPDSVSRYAYAELLFQQEKFESAGANYEEVSQNKKIDKTKQHDALYGALFSLEKQMLASQKSTKRIQLLLLLLGRFLQESTYVSSTKWYNTLPQRYFLPIVGSTRI